MRGGNLFSAIPMLFFLLRLHDTICSQADRVVAASMTDQESTEEGSEQAMIKAPGTPIAVPMQCLLYTDH